MDPRARHDMDSDEEAEFFEQHRDEFNAMMAAWAANGPPVSRLTEPNVVEHNNPERIQSVMEALMAAAGASLATRTLPEDHPCWYRKLPGEAEAAQRGECPWRNEVGRLVQAE